jgi:hypothetical protein
MASSHAHASCQWVVGPRNSCCARERTRVAVCSSVESFEEQPPRGSWNNSATVYKIFSSHAACLAHSCQGSGRTFNGRSRSPLLLSSLDLRTMVSVDLKTLFSVLLSVSRTSL